MLFRSNPQRMGKRIDKEWLGEPIQVEQENIMTAIVEYANGVLGTIHFNSESIIEENSHLEIYGTDGIIEMNDPNQFGGDVYLTKQRSNKIVFPPTHGYRQDTRGALVFCVTFLQTFSSSCDG